jgi:cytochrome c peroxidase
MSVLRTTCAALLAFGTLSAGCQQSNVTPPATDPKERLALLVLPQERTLPKDVTNRYADDPRAAALGKKFFFDTRFSGPLLDSANTGAPGTLGRQGETGKVACASCHMPASKAFADIRSSRSQLSFASGWTHRHAPALLDVAEAKILTWDGRHDTAYNQVFQPVESALEFNSSRLFVAQQIARLYRAEYEAIFGALPSLTQYPVLEPAQAGCTERPADPMRTSCERHAADDEAVTRVLVNFGKAVQAFTRTLTCGPSRFDAWMNGDAAALDAQEQAGAFVFVKAGCDTCHSGPYLTDQRFHNLGVPGGRMDFTDVNTANDPGAAEGLAKARTDWLNSKGRFSDGDDGRLDKLPRDLSAMLGAFRTPTLRCVSRRPAFMHNGYFRSLEIVVRFFSEGSKAGGYVGRSVNFERGLSEEEQTQLVAFLNALDGSGPDPAQLELPVLPP